MNEYLFNFRNGLLSDQIRNDNTMLNASVPPMIPAMEYSKYNMPNQYYGVANQPKMLFGQGMLGYETPITDGMLSGRVGLDKARLNWNNQNNDVDIRANTNGDASINWTGRF